MAQRLVREITCQQMERAPSRGGVGERVQSPEVGGCWASSGMNRMGSKAQARSTKGAEKKQGPDHLGSCRSLSGIELSL